MCIFTGPVENVSRTQIYARLEGERQVLVYSMHVDAPAALAMVLPLPVPPGCGEDALEFVDLSEYPELFQEIAGLFVSVQSYDVEGDRAFLDDSFGDEPLEVHDVGSYEASFVPTVADFARLDPRFQLSDRVWKKLPQYADWGFAVFKLKAGDDLDFHPMAFWFPTRNPEKVFFPTVHVHHGDVFPEAEFDHVLYAQLPHGRSPAFSGSGLSPLAAETRDSWTQSHYEVSEELAERSEQVLSPRGRCLRLKLPHVFDAFTLPNNDVILPLV